MAEGFRFALRKEYAAGSGGLPFIGSPDDVASYLAHVSAAGFPGWGLSFVNPGDEFPYFRQEVLPRLEKRACAGR